MFEASEEALAELGGDEDTEDNPGDGDNPDVPQEGRGRPRKRSRKDLSARNRALRVIVSYTLPQHIYTSNQRGLMNACSKY